MKNGLKALVIGGVLLAGASAPAMARSNVSFSVGFGAPVYAPAYVAPAPVYYAPPPVVYYRPAPAPVYYGYGAPAVGFTYYSGPGWRHHHRGYHHR